MWGLGGGSLFLEGLATDDFGSGICLAVAQSRSSGSPILRSFGPLHVSARAYRALWGSHDHDRVFGSWLWYGADCKGMWSLQSLGFRV